MTLFENKNIKPMNLTFWKEIKEEAGAAGGAGGAASAGVSAGSMASGMAALGGTPTPALAQLSRSGISAATVNGIPVPSQSTRKKKKKKKNEDLILDTTNQNLEIRALITKAIAEENDAITSYLEKAKRCKELGIDKLVDLFNELAKDETVHTGCLQAALDEFDLSELDDVLDGQEEAQEIFDKIENTNIVNTEIENVIEQLLQEDFHEAYEEITNLLAKQLDRMNFEFANTEDIIYKKEGKYKYLLKFDNKNGFLKFKISKDDNVIEVREWQLDEGQDISPIFKEIEDLYNKYGI